MVEGWIIMIYPRLVLRIFILKNKKTVYRSTPKKEKGAPVGCAMDALDLHGLSQWVGGVVTSWRSRLPVFRCHGGAMSWKSECREDDWRPISQDWARVCIFVRIDIFRSSKMFWTIGEWTKREQETISWKDGFRVLKDKTSRLAHERVQIRGKKKVGLRSMESKHGPVPLVAR